MRALLASSLSLMLSVGCSGPEQGITPPQGPGNAPAGGDAVGGGGGGGAGGPPAFGRVDPPGFVLGENEGVELSGRLTYLDEAEPVGSLRLEIMAVVSEAETTLLAVQDLEELGDWTMRVPADLGEITVLAYFDAEMNGPSPGEPIGQLFENIVVGSEDISGIDLAVSAMEPGPPPGDGAVEGEGDQIIQGPDKVGKDPKGEGEKAPEGEAQPIEEAPEEAAPEEAAPAEAAPAEAAPAEEPAAE